MSPSDEGHPEFNSPDMRLVLDISRKIREKEPEIPNKEEINRLKEIAEKTHEKTVLTLICTLHTDNMGKGKLNKTKERRIQDLTMIKGIAEKRIDQV